MSRMIRRLLDRRLVLAAVAITMLLSISPLAIAATPIYVRTDGDDTNCNGTKDEAYPGSGGPDLDCAVATIQQGVDLVDAEGIVTVRAGTFAERVVIGKSIHLRGAGYGMSVGDRTAGDSNETIIDATGSQEAVIIKSSDVTIDGFDVVGDEDTYVGVLVYPTASAGSLDTVGVLNNFIHGMALPNPNSTSYVTSYGVFSIGDSVGGIRNTLSGLTIEGNEIFDVGGVVVGSDTSAGAGVWLYSIQGSAAGDGAFVTGNYFHHIADGYDGSASEVEWGTAVAIVDDGDTVADKGAAVASNAYGDTFAGVVLAAFGGATSMVELGESFSGVRLLALNAGNLATIDESSLEPYVRTDKPVQFDNSTAYFVSIQDALDMSVAAASVDISAGTFAENLWVTKAVTIAGSGQEATTIFPAVSLPNPCSGGSMCGSRTAASNIVLVEADNVTIRDLMLDGDNPDLTSGVIRGGADLDARNGILQWISGEPYDDLLVHDVVVRNIYLRGIYGSNGTFEFRDNVVTNVQGDAASIAMFAWGGPGRMVGNVVSLANDAISANHSKGIEFIDNVVTQSGSGVHTDNAGSGGGVGDVVRGNVISDCADNGYGVFVFHPYIAPTVTENTIVGCSVGISAWGQAAAVTTEFSRNVVDGTGGGVGSVGVYVTTDLISWGYRDVSVAFENNVVSGVDVGLFLSADQQTWNPQPFQARTVTAEFRDNSIVAGVLGAEVGTDGTYDIDASGNWWGSGSPAVVAALVGGDEVIDYTPWLAAGTDTSAEMGFQGDFSVLWVDDDSPQTGSTGRIQEGLNLVTGSTVIVAPGTYPETVTLTGHDQVLRGGDPDDRPSITGGINANGRNGVELRDLIVTGVGGGAFVISAGGNGFLMDGVRVDGEEVVGRGGVGGGRLDGDISVTRSEFVNIRHWAAFDTRSGSGGPASGSTIGTAVFSDNVVRNTQGHVNVRGSIGSPSQSVVVSGNLVEDVGTATNSFGGIIKVFYADAVVFSNNTVRDVGTSGYNPSGEAAYGAGFMPRNVGQLTVEGNVFENNHQAVAIEPRNGLVDGHADGVLSAGVFSGNVFSENVYGVYIPGTLHAASDFDELVVHSNRFEGSAVQAVHNGYAAGVVDARGNWWNSGCGPGPVGPGTGDGVSTYVDYSPWWTDPTGAFSLGEDESGTWIIPAGASREQAQAILDAVGSCGAGKTVVFEPDDAAYPGGLEVRRDGITVQINGNIIGSGSPAFTISGSDVTLEGPGTLDGEAASAPGILVVAGADNATVRALEITGWADGIQIAGDVVSLKILENWVHSNDGSGLLVDEDVTVDGIINIHGNLFKANGGLGIQNDGGPDPLPAEYNSWGSRLGPDGSGGDGVSDGVDFEPWTFAELYLDMKPDTGATAREVVESQSFDVKLRVDAANLYGLAFDFTFDQTMLTLTGTAFASPWAGRCTVVGPTPVPPGTVRYRCNLLAPDDEYSAEGGTIATFSFTAQNNGGLTDDGPWTALFDIAAEESKTSAGAVGGIKVFVDNAGFNEPSSEQRDISDDNDGEVEITGIANFKGFVDLQGRPNDSGATINVYDQAAKAAATLTANAVSSAGGGYSTAHYGGNLLAVGSTYWLVVNRDLFLPTTAVDVEVTTHAHSKILATRPWTNLGMLLLLGGDATNDNVIDVGDASCIGGGYLLPVTSCGGAAGSSTDANGDGVVNILDLTLMAGNYNLASSGVWTP